MLNRENLAKDIDCLIAELSKYSDAIKSGDEEQLQNLLWEGKECKVHIDESSGAL